MIQSLTRQLTQEGAETAQLSADGTWREQLQAASFGPGRGVGFITAYPPGWEQEGEAGTLVSPRQAASESVSLVQVDTLAPSCATKQSLDTRPSPRAGGVSSSLEPWTAHTPRGPPSRVPGREDLGSRGCSHLARCYEFLQ